MYARQQRQHAHNGLSQRRGAHQVLVNYEKSVEDSIMDLSQFDNSLHSAAEYYFQHAKKLYLDNLALCQRVAILEQQKQDLHGQLKKYETLAATKSLNESAPVNEEKKRRKRRNASEIERLYRCRAEGCGKSYGSEGTLSQHLKLKHNELFIQMYGDGEERQPLTGNDPDKSREEMHLDSEMSKPKSDPQQF